MNEPTLSKVPEVTLTFWVIKIAATTLGETGGDSVTMTLNWGYLAGTVLFFGVLTVFTEIVPCDQYQRARIATRHRKSSVEPPV